MEIKTELSYNAILDRITELMNINPEACTEEYDEMIKSVDAVEKYEEEHEPWSMDIGAGSRAGDPGIQSDHQIHNNSGYAHVKHSCAASPWIFRTDTGDKTGKVVEDAELPEIGPEKNYLVLNVTKPKRCGLDIIKGLRWVGEISKVNIGWLSKNCIAYAEIQGVE